MNFANISLAIVAVVATLAGSWQVGSRASLKAALEESEIIIGMLSVKVGLLEDRIQELENQLGE